VDSADLFQWLMRVRTVTRGLAEPLSAEDQQIQSMPDASPTKWHLAHTTWFFDEFVLKPNARRYQEFDPRYSYLFNSYYDSVGGRHPRAARGLLSRPPLTEVLAYRMYVDEALGRLIEGGVTSDVEQAIVLGINHEQQHQELILTDIKHALGTSPLRPRYVGAALDDDDEPQATRASFIPVDAGITRVGHTSSSFAFDNEGPAHRYFLEAHELCDRLVTVQEYLEFIRDGGYRRPELWLAEGRSWIEREHVEAPLYWRIADEEMSIFDLRGGSRPLDRAEPVCHVSYYEADAYARWAGARLPTEFEWEAAASARLVAGNMLDGGRLHPRPAIRQEGVIRQLFGDVWEWTQSAYGPYPGYRTPVGAFGEYNGKFMCNQFVLRGGSCLTPSEHLRHTYRNFFPADARWQMSGIRLARSKGN
jgi:ergothioneine biosynthesis protein EgtB